MGGHGDLDQDIAGGSAIAARAATAPDANLLPIFEGGRNFHVDLLTIGQHDASGATHHAFGETGRDGNGEILAYNATTDLFLGILDGSNGDPLTNDNLWALETRNASGFNSDAVYFSAGINGQADGLFGEITFTPEPASIVGTATGLLALAFARVRRHLSRNSRIS